MWKDLISGTTALVYFLGDRKIILTYKKWHLIGIALLSLSCVCNFVPDARKFLPLGLVVLSYPVASLFLPS